MDKRCNPALVLAISLAAALIFALAIVVVFEGEFRTFLLVYFVPIAVPFVAFIFDRMENWPTLPKNLLWIEAPVLVLALFRSFAPIPFISGHALFLTYSLGTTRSRVARLTAAAVLVEVVVIKIFAWHDPTLFGGMLLGTIAAFIFRAMPLPPSKIPEIAK